MVHTAAPIIEQEEVDAVNKVLESGQLAQGPKVAELEAAFADYCGTKYAAAVNSGTAALHAALYAAGVGPGDEVITVPYTFMATFNSILMAGAKPVLVDIEPVAFNIDVTKIEQAITSKTKVIMPVHLYGQPCDSDELKTIADKHGIKIIEDACQAVGAEYKGRLAGNLGDLGCFSLYATKNIMCGEGGVITTNDESYLTAIKQFRQHGMSAQYDYVDIGYNYRLTDLQAAIAVEQLKKIGRFTAARQKNAAALNEGLKDIKGIILPVTAANRTHVYHQYTIRITDECKVDRQTLIDKLKERGVFAGMYYPKGLHEFAHVQKYGYKVGDFPVTEQTTKEVLSLPVHPRVTADDIKLIIQVIKEVA
ncbi:MAG: DegT/DnrJ/EryC1/StrS family aminotransferase [Candidatus Saccharimonadales bacterium]